VAHEIVQQPVKQFRPKSANVLEMPDFIGCLQFFASDSKGQTDLKLPGKVYCTVLHLGEGPGADCALFSG
jgi:hypothetical protein